MDWDGKVAVVTGGTRGVGAGIARAFAEGGAQVVICARRPPEMPLKGAEFMPLDLRDADAVHDFFAALARVDVLVNNAGGWDPRPIMATSPRNVEAAFKFNVVAAYTLTQLCVPHMVEAGAGSVVNISSRAASMVQPCFVAYATAKAALSMMTRAMAPELAPLVRVNAIEVGGVETAALAHVLTDDSIRHRLESNTPMQRIGRPDDIAAAVLYLASDAAGWVTGKVFEVDGGVESPAFTIPFEPLGGSTT
jgi:NAD(P)-dependent dehydrogenase (short-subunit alcohol dehydrogenase family)